MLIDWNVLDTDMSQTASKTSASLFQGTTLQLRTHLLVNDSLDTKIYVQLAPHQPAFAVSVQTDQHGVAEPLSLAKALEDVALKIRKTAASLNINKSTV